MVKHTQTIRWLTPNELFKLHNFVGLALIGLRDVFSRSHYLINPFHATSSLFPWKHQKTRAFVFRGYRERPAAKIWVKNLAYNSAIIYLFIVNIETLKEVWNMLLTSFWCFWCFTSFSHSCWLWTST